MTTRFVILFALAACPAETPSNPPGGGSGSGSGSGGGGNTALTATKFLDQIGHKMCDQAYACKSSYPNDPETFYGQYGSTAQECYADAQAADMPSIVEQRIVAGTIKWNATDAATCVQGIKFPGDCFDFWEGDTFKPAACRTALMGTLADGAKCKINFECVSSFCDGGSGECAASTPRLSPASDDDLPMHMDTRLLR